MSAPKREHLLKTAEAIFSKEGFKGISVDRLLSESGVAKMTLYKGFESKDALIQETLKRRAARLAAHIDAWLKNAGSEPIEQLLGCFDAMKAWSTQDNFNGCYFINAMAEYAAEDNHISKIVKEYKAFFLARLEQLCEICEIDNPAEMAKAMLQLIDGAIVVHMTLEDDTSYDRAKSMAKCLLQR